MKDQFQVWEYNFPVKGPHPVVLISHPEICKVSQTVNIHFCTSQRQSRPPKTYEVLLNGADGLDWETFCDCSILYAIKSSELSKYRGMVSLERRRAIRAKLRGIFRLEAMD